MTILDANILLYAYNADAPAHAVVSQWLEDLFESEETIALPWITIWAFIRISTNGRIWDKPLPAEKTFAIINELLDKPAVVLLAPGARHRELLENLILKHQATGSLVTDAVLAALALENGAWLASTDRDFSRFGGLRWVNPLGL